MKRSTPSPTGPASTGQTSFDLAVEDQAMSRPVAVALAHYHGLNFNRLIAVRMAYLKGQFSDWPRAVAA